MRIEELDANLRRGARLSRLFYVFLFLLISVMAVLPFKDSDLGANWWKPLGVMALFALPVSWHVFATTRQSRQRLTSQGIEDVRRPGVLQLAWTDVFRVDIAHEHLVLESEDRRRVKIDLHYGVDTKAVRSGVLGLVPPAALQRPPT